MSVKWTVEPRLCAACGRVFRPGSPKAKYCSDACRREVNRVQARLCRSDPDRQKRDKVDRYLAPTGPAHGHDLVVRREVAKRY